MAGPLERFPAHNPSVRRRANDSHESKIGHEPKIGHDLKIGPGIAPGSADRRRGRCDSGGAVASAWARPAPESFADLAERVTPAVVNISIERDLAEAEGSGPMGGHGMPNMDDPSVQEYFERFFGRDWAERMPGQRRPGNIFTRGLYF